MKIDQLHHIFLASTGISTDTRSIAENNLFFALKGDNFNGNTYAKKALKSGASFAIIDEAEYQEGDVTILVKNVLETLQKLANYHRKYWSKPIIGITGSNGKTTTKELLASCLETTYNIYATKGNLNNHIGVPLTLLSLNETHEMAIVEMGANHVNEISELCKIAEPDYGIITNIGEAHLEGFGSIENIAKTKKELFESVCSKCEGIVFVNHNNPFLKDFEHQRAISYGFENTTVDFNGKVLECEHAGIEVENIQLKSNLVGSHNAENILAAYAVSKTLGVTTQNIRKAIEGYFPDNNRSQIVSTEKNQILLDAYNANPTSLQATLNSFIKNNETRSSLVILGDMFELGENSENHHLQIIKWLDINKVNAHLVGLHFKKAFEKYGRTSNFIQTFEKTEDQKLKDLLTTIEGKNILVKGSRGMKLETLVPLL